MELPIEIRRRRASWRASHRGTKELDILIGKFADAKLATMTDAELSRFENFLSVSDPNLSAWLLTGAAEPAPEHLALVREVRAFHGLGQALTND